MDVLALATLTTPSTARPAVHLRRIRPGDREGLTRFYAGLSPDSRRLRFFSAGSGLSASAAQGFCQPDHAHEEGFVAVLGPGGHGADAAGTIVGHFCLVPSGPAELEMAIAIADAYQRQGLGRRLVRHGTAWARRHGYERLRATILADNVPMLRLLHATGGQVHLGPPSAGVIPATVELAPVEATVS